jgi:hypothetical protein
MVDGMGFGDNRRELRLRHAEKVGLGEHAAP